MALPPLPPAEEARSAPLLYLVAIRLKGYLSLLFVIPPTSPRYG